MSEQLFDRAGRCRSPASMPGSTPVARRATRGCAIRRTRRLSRKSSPSCVRRALLVRRGKGGRRREVGMDEWAWEQLRPWLDLRLELPVGPLFCVNGPTRGRPWSAAAVRADLRCTATAAGVRRRF